jgi:aspartate/tyrosine/aromatic aminotransferase
LVFSGVVLAKAASFRAKFASRQICVVSTDSWPNHRAITEQDTGLQQRQAFEVPQGVIAAPDLALELQELIEAAERVCYENFGKTSAVTLLKKKAVNG